MPMLEQIVVSSASITKHPEPILTKNDIPYDASLIFPGGMILEPDGEVKIYYGANDTVECVATAHVNDLIRLCTEKR